ncbi:MAG: UbiX family flavin prenyltransferase [Bacteroidales bacterium]
MHKKRIIVAITGASGSIYATRLLVKLSNLENQISEIALIISETGKQVYDYEIGKDIPESKLIRTFSNDSFFAPVASGSAGYNAMTIIPCTAGTMGRVANGTSNDLIARSADVMLKERRPLVLVLRESPYSLIHIDNMRKITLAGGTVFPASPSFYSKPDSITSLVDTVVDRVIGLLGLNIDAYKWGDE